MSDTTQPMPFTIGFTTTHNTIVISEPMMIATIFANPLIMRY